MRAALPFALLAACVPLGPAKLPVLERQAVEAAQAGWEATGHPHCRALDTIGVIYAWAPCGNRNSADCVEMRGRRQMIVIREGQPVFDSTGGPVIHGAMHACEGSTSEVHADPRIWIAAGGASSAQGRARGMLKQP